LPRLFLLPRKYAICRHGGARGGSDLRQRPAITRCPVFTCARPDEITLSRDAGRDHPEQVHGAGRGPGWASGGCLLEGDGGREALVRRCGPGGCGGCVPRDAPRPWRSRFVTGYRRMMLVDPEGNGVKVAARLDCRDAAECGEGRAHSNKGTLPPRRGGVRRLPSRGSWPCRRGSGCRRGCAASARRARQTA
jgi:hypothetical protein